MMHKQTKPSNEAGFVTIEILGALAVLTIILSVVYSLWSTELVEMQKRAVAKHFDTVSIAAQEYAEDNKTDLLSAASLISGNMISIAELKDEGFLPDGFNAKNPWQQEYKIYTRKNSRDTLQLIILTIGGRAHTTDEPKFGHVVVPSTAAITPISFIPVGEETTLRDAYGAGDENLAAMNIPEEQRKAGHLGSVITIADASTGGSGGGGGTTPELDLSGKIDSVQFEEKSWKDDMLYDPHGYCKEPEDIGKIYFSNNCVDGTSYIEECNGLFICMRYQQNKIKMMKFTVQPNDLNRVPHPTQN